MSGSVFESNVFLLIDTIILRVDTIVCCEVANFAQLSDGNIYFHRI